jgi:ATP-dependent RNA helicase DeaD
MIERGTNQKIEHMQLPTTESINDIRVSRFKQRITDTLAEEELGFYYQLLEEYRQEHNIPELEIAAALARLLQGDTPLLLDLKEPASAPVAEDREQRRPREFERERSRPPAPEWKQPEDFIVTETYRLDVGNVHGVKAGQIIGAIANEAGLEGKYIRNLQIRDDHSLVELPENMPKEILQILKKARVCSRPLRLKLDESPGAGPTRHSLKKKEKFKKKKGPPDHHGGAKKKFKKK